MDAKVGDEIHVDSPHTGSKTRTGTILEVLRSGGSMHFRVRWDDGHESVYFPGSDANVVHTGTSRS
jgi:hypothetical protein